MFFLFEISPPLFTDATHMKKHHTVLCNIPESNQKSEVFLFQNNSCLMYYLEACGYASGWFYHYKHYTSTTELLAYCQMSQANASESFFSPLFMKTV